ncbi:MAG: hypothetical protein JSV92_03910 [archaeon]|nr:MAG: hypothetical protein JSV92_03910 [archaeon]
MLDKETAGKINEFVYTKPRSIDEIARHIGVNWRTANRYVEKISSEEGTISVRVFRKGTRGSLKVVFWNNIEKLHASEVQERLFKQIQAGRKKGDFSPSEIFQFVDSKKKKLKIMDEKEYSSASNFRDFAGMLRGAKRQVLFYSGNLTFSNMAHHDKKIRDILEELGKEKISSKVLTRVELAGIENIKNILSINERVGHDAVEVRHCYQPLRTTIVDDKLAAFKEILNPQIYAKGELKEKMFILYYVYDEDWIEWLQKVFWNLFRSSLDAKSRIRELKLFI